MLDTETLSSFVNGAYEVWTVSGHVKITITNLAGPNAVFSGLFFDPVSTLSPASTPMANGSAFLETDEIGTVDFTHSDSQAGSPVNGTVARADLGMYAFTVPSKTKRTQTITAG